MGHLDDIEIASPCTVPWALMKGSEWVRHCGRCDLNVYNLSALTREEALALVRRTEGRLCVHLRRRPDGTVVTQDCWSRIRAARQRGLWAAFTTAALVLPLALFAQVRGFLALRGLLQSRLDELRPTERLVPIRLRAPPPPLPAAPAPDGETIVSVTQGGIAAIGEVELDQGWDDDGPPSRWRVVPPRLPGSTPPPPRVRHGGQFLFRVCADAEGHPRDVRLLRAPDARDARRVAAYVRQWRYEPYLVDGVAVPFCTVARVFL